MAQATEQKITHCSIGRGTYAQHAETEKQILIRGERLCVHPMCMDNSWYMVYKKSLHIYLLDFDNRIYSIPIPTIVDISSPPQSTPQI